MNSSSISVKVIVPVYKEQLDKYEWISLNQNWNILKSHQFVFIHPEGLNIKFLLDKFPGSTEEIFDKDYFSNISGYNKLMMSSEFYKRFTDTDYLLICQLDVYIFSDRLIEWCNKGYDYVGAPWQVSSIFRLPLFKQWRKIFHSKRRTQKDFKVGNGGLSLRKVSSHLRATEMLKDAITSHLSLPRHYSNEDLFFALEVNKHGMNFSYPNYKEALQFSFDKYPSICYRDNNNKLPFGCHAWYKEKMKDFWFPIILKS